ncbi:MAG: hypothetical protein KAI64_03875 [Thermoplasmata archaeon]|nr:hypothetical protein [Thermoplasmata archaeon]
MTPGSDRTELISLFGKAFLVGVERGEEEYATLFAKALLVCKELNSSEN